MTAEGTGSWLNAGIGKRDGKVTEQMDVFAAGCVLLEVWTDGASIFTLSELYGYRKGKYQELEGILGSLEDVSVRVSRAVTSRMAKRSHIRLSCLDRP